MDLTHLGLFGSLRGKMDWLTQRSKVIAGNIANADTPGYQAQDIAPFTFKAMMNRLQPVQTNAMHLQLASTSTGASKETSAIKNEFEIKPDGNAVSTEQEIAKAAQTAADYQLTSNIYKQTIGLIEDALGSPNG